MMIGRKSFVIVCLLAFAGSGAGVCLCADHDGAASAAHHEHASEPAHHHHSHPGDGHEHDSGNGPADSCCCTVADHQLAILETAPTISILLSAIPAPPLAHVPASAGLERQEKRHPPPKEGFKAWPDVLLFLQHSALLV